MIDYEIIHVDKLHMNMQVKYTLDDNPAYFTRVAFELPITEENLHHLAKTTAFRAQNHWKRVQVAQDFTLSVGTGQAKPTVFTDKPEFDADVESCTERLEETDTELRIVYDITALDANQQIAAIRQKRDSLLAATDYYMFPDRPVSDEMVAYRQALRELPEQSGFPENITWPVRPVD